MERTELGRSGTRVSAWCLGTMTYGTQTPPKDAHRQLEMARDAGIDFLDTAEMYPVNPARAETLGRTEEILGDWFARTGRRDEWVVATKILGPSGLARDGAGVTPETVREAVEGSLRRLRTDRIDLYQFHWPNRGSYHFRQNWGFDPSGQDPAEVADHMAEVMDALKALVAEGKIGAFGLSNDSAWGATRWCDAAERAGGPRPLAVQNEYSLLCRLYDTDLAEAARQEGFTLLAYSPLAAGLLTGKYHGGERPEGSRAAVNGNLGGRWTDRALAAAAAYAALARTHGLDPVHMALAFTRQRPFSCVPIVGASSAAQLAHMLGGADLVLEDDVLEGIDALHRAHPMPY